MAYKHGVYVAEQGTSIVAPVTATAGLQVVIGTAPINRASDPYHCTNTPMLANTLAGATAAVGYDDDYEKYTVCQSMGASFKVVGVSPMILINVLDPNKHKKNLPEKTVQVNDGVAVVEEKDILLDKLTVKAEETPLAAGTDYTAAFDDNGYVNIVVIPGGAGDSATSLTVSGVQIDPTAVTPADIVGAVTADGVESGMEVNRQKVKASDFVSDMEEDLQIMAQKRKIRLTMDIVLENIEIWVDPSILYRVLENVFGNALRYAKERVRIEVSLENQLLSFTIIDDGNGFSEEVLTRQKKLLLAKPSEDGHLGMGLAISRILCKKHGGRLEIRNDVGHHAVVNVTFSVNDTL